MEKATLEPIDSEVLQIITEFLHEEMHLPGSILNENNWDEPLTGNIFQLSGIDLIYLFFELEKHFGVQINPKHLSLYGFGTIRKICKAIVRSAKTI